MNCEAEHYESAWAHVGLFADTAWAPQPPDEFTKANQYLWARYCRQARGRAQAPRAAPPPPLRLSPHASSSPAAVSDESPRKLSVADVIPESRLARFYGEFFYDEEREKCYKTFDASVPSHSSASPPSPKVDDSGECWATSEVEYWYQRLTSPRPSSHARRDAHCLADPVTANQALPCPHHCAQLANQQSMLATKERLQYVYGTLAPSPPRYHISSPEEAVLKQRLEGTRGLWTELPVCTRPLPRSAHSRKIRARRTSRHYPPKRRPSAPPGPGKTLTALPVLPPCLKLAIKSSDTTFNDQSSQTDEATYSNGGSIPRNVLVGNKNIPVYQRPVEFYTRQVKSPTPPVHTVRVRPYNGPGVDYSNLILLTNNQRSKISASQSSSRSLENLNKIPNYQFSRQYQLLNAKNPQQDLNAMRALQQNILSLQHQRRMVENLQCSNKIMTNLFTPHWIRESYTRRAEDFRNVCALINEINMRAANPSVLRENYMSENESGSTTGEYFDAQSEPASSTSWVASGTPESSPTKEQTTSPDVIVSVVNSAVYQSTPNSKVNNYLYSHACMGASASTHDYTPPSNQPSQDQRQNLSPVMTEDYHPGPISRQIATPETGLAVLDLNATPSKKRLYSTVLSAGVPVQAANLDTLKKKQVDKRKLYANIRPVFCSSKGKRVLINADTHFEELEKEAIEQYKASDESLNRKFRELEEQALDQYSGTSNSNVSNSNTSCNSGQSNATGSFSRTGQCKPKSNCEGNKCVGNAREKCSSDNAGDCVKTSTQEQVESITTYSSGCTASRVEEKPTKPQQSRLKNVKIPPRAGESKQKQGKDDTSTCQRLAATTKSSSKCICTGPEIEARRESDKSVAKRRIRLISPKKRLPIFSSADNSSDEDIAKSDETIGNITVDAKTTLLSTALCTDKCQTGKRTEPGNRNSNKARHSAHPGGDLPTINILHDDHTNNFT